MKFPVRKKMKQTKGQSLVEVIVAVFVISIVLVTLVSSVTYSLRNSNYSKNKSLASKYAQEGLDAVRSIKERDWTLFTGASDTDKGIIYNRTNKYWEFASSPGFDYPSGSTLFKRVVRVFGCSGSPVTSCSVNVKVYWNDKGSYDAYSENTTIFSRY